MNSGKKIRRFAEERGSRFTISTIGLVEDL